MNKLKSIILVGVAVLACVGVLISCNKKDESQASAETQGGRLTAMLNQGRLTKGFQDMLRKLEEEEGIVIDIQVVPEDQYENLLTMKINSGEAPDIMDMQVAPLYGFLDAPNLLVDLSDEPWVDKLVNPGLSIHDDGNIYAFAYESSAGFQAMCYNKELFAAVGYEEPPTTEAEFFDLCQKLLDYGVTPIGVASEIWMPQIYMTGGFARVLGSNEKVKQFSDNISNRNTKYTDYPEFIPVIDHYKSLFDNGFVNSDYLTTNIEGIHARIVEGEIAMMASSSAFFTELVGTYPDAPVGLFNMPTNYDTKDVLSTEMFAKCFFVPKTSKKIDLVKKVFRLWSTPEYLSLIFNDVPAFSGFSDVDGGALHPEVLKVYNEYLERNAMVMEVNNALVKLQPLYKSTLWIYYQELPTNGWSSKELLERFQKDVDIYLDELDG